MKIYRATVSKIYTIDVLVLSKNDTEAKNIVENDLEDGIIDPEDDCEPEVKFDYIHEEPLINIKSLRQEIKDYGVLCENSIEYDPDVLDDVEKKELVDAKEKWLKENHMEFDFNENGNR